MKNSKNIRKNYFNFFDTSFIVLIFITLISGIAVYLIKGIDILYLSLVEDLNLLLKILPILGGGILLVGSMHILLPSKFIGKWLGKESGFKGILIATLVGGVTPGGPMVSFPLLISLRSKGADIGSLIAFITAWTTISFTRTIAWEIPLMGIDFTIIRFLSSLILPIIAGLLYRKFFNNYFAMEKNN
ncbi:MAG: hypothetical protein CMM49_01320 [Rhodospirillaceae bacterium]|nr:hypothetical protein [Rhodospirillaceae bacterium]|tara:strand:+ start:181 stop:741 length:561 start_codon:yes stop_codon:yes gene_type:complete